MRVFVFLYGLLAQKCEILAIFIHDYDKMVFWDGKKILSAGNDMLKREEFEIVDIEIDVEEALIRDAEGTAHPVDLRGEYLEIAKKWHRGQKIMAALASVRSRYRAHVKEGGDGKDTKIER